MKKTRQSPPTAPLFAPRLTSFQQVDWPVVMESYGFQYIGLCTDRDRPGCYGKLLIVDEVAAPLQGLPFVSPFQDPKDQELNQLLHQLQFTEQLPHRAATMMLPAEVEFLTAWVPTGMPAAFFGSYYDSTLVQRRAMFLRECIDGCRQHIYHRRLNTGETAHQRIAASQRAELSSQRWAKVDAQREEDRLRRARLRRETGRVIAFEPPAQLDIFSVAA